MLIPNGQSDLSQQIRMFSYTFSHHELYILTPVTISGLVVIRYLTRVGFIECGCGETSFTHFICTQYFVVVTCTEIKTGTNVCMLLKLHANMFAGIFICFHYRIPSKTVDGRHHEVPYTHQAIIQSHTQKVCGIQSTLPKTTINLSC